MRKLSEIKSEIKAHEDAIKNLQDEIRKFQGLCDHPDKFLKVIDIHHVYDINTYEESNIKVECILCELQKSMRYNRNDRKIQPTMKEVINS